MTRRVFSWLRVVIPLGWVLAFGILALLPIEVLFFCLRSYLSENDAANLLEPRDAVLCFATFVYGIYRAVAFHPLFRVAYREWLSLTPWKTPQPLPLGPIHLVLQDVALFSLVAAIQHDPVLGRLAPGAAFLFGYLCILAFAFLFTCAKSRGYLLAFGLGFALRVDVDSVAGIAILGTLYLVALRGLRISLAQFPWSGLRDWSNLTVQLDRKKQIATWSGWPHDQLLSPSNDRRWNLSEKTIWSLLAGWWFYVLASGPWNDGNLPGSDLSLYLYPLVVLAAVAARLLVYCKCYWPPISLWGRLWTLRWIIPGYDQVLVAPLLALLTAILIPWCLALVGVPGHVSLSVATTVIAWITLNHPPSFITWKTTGQHRIVPDHTIKAEFIRQ